MLQRIGFFAVLLRLLGPPNYRLDLESLLNQPITLALELAGPGDVGLVVRTGRTGPRTPAEQGGRRDAGDVRTTDDFLVTLGSTVGVN